MAPGASVLSSITHYPSRTFRIEVSRARVLRNSFAILHTGDGICEYFPLIHLWYFEFRCWTQLGITWWRHQIETFSALLTICAGNSPVTGEFPAQRPVTRSFDIFFDLRLHKRLSKQSWGWWFETPSRPLWRHCNDLSWSFRSWIAQMTFFKVISIQ